MCLITEQKVAQIAKEDIIVYKNVILGDEKCMSPIHGFKYKFNKLYTSATLRPKSIIGLKFADDFSIYDLRVGSYYFLDKKVNVARGEIIIDNKCCNYVVISKGFHSFKTKYRSHYNVICIIPKGSEYFEDETGLIVSNKIIIKEIIK